jgi:hypothetical protein
VTEIVTPDKMFGTVRAEGFRMDKLNTRITEHFTWAEVFHNRTLVEVQQAGLPIFKNGLTQARLMERIRVYLSQKLGHEAIIIVKSWFRSLAANRSAGGASRSSHLQALATDFSVVGYEGEAGNRYIQALLIPFVFPTCFCLELTGGPWTHADSRLLRYVFDNKGRVLTGAEQKAFVKQWGRGS